VLIFNATILIHGVGSFVGSTWILDVVLQTQGGRVMGVFQANGDLDQVRIPAELTGTLSQFFVGLQSQIFEQAARTVCSRSGSEQSIVVSTEAFARVALEVSVEATSKLKETFADSVLKHPSCFPN
jgi:hypothetical protein